MIPQAMGEHPLVSHVYKRRWGDISKTLLTKVKPLTGQEIESEDLDGENEAVVGPAMACLSKTRQLMNSPRSQKPDPRRGSTRCE